MRPTNSTQVYDAVFDAVRQHGGKLALTPAQGGSAYLLHLETPEGLGVGAGGPTIDMAARMLVSLHLQIDGGIGEALTQLATTYRIPALR